MATPNMNLLLPIPTVTIGPQWASELNTAITSVDSHDHSTGKGVRIKPDGININSDLDIQTNALNNVTGVRLTASGSIPSGGLDIREVFSFNGDLYYNNGVGTSVRITNGAGLDASTVGGIGGDYGTTPAVVNYVNANKTYTFDSEVNARGAIDIGALTIRETDVAGANGVTLETVPSLTGSYTAILPGALPPSTQLMTMSSAGAMDYADTDESTLETTGAGVLQVKDLGITTSKLAANSVTNFNIADQSINGFKLQNGTVNSAQLGITSVSTAKLANQAVTNDKIQFQGIRGTRLDLFSAALAFGSSGTPVTINVPNHIYMARITVAVTAFTTSSTWILTQGATPIMIGVYGGTYTTTLLLAGTITINPPPGTSGSFRLSGFNE